MLAGFKGVVSLLLPNSGLQSCARGSGSALERTAAHDDAHEHCAVARRRKLCPSKVCPAECFPPRSLQFPQSFSLALLLGSLILTARRARWGSR
jgi:hypothetical protein